MGKTLHELETVLRAISGSTGIKTTIAQRLNVDRRTVDNYLERWTTAKEAYNAEVMTIADVAESVVFTNIKLAARVQQSGISADSSDAKWYLSRKVKGYSDKTEVTGEDGGPILVKGYAIFKPDDWDTDDADA